MSSKKALANFLFRQEDSSDEEENVKRIKRGKIQKAVKVGKQRIVQKASKAKRRPESPAPHYVDISKAQKTAFLQRVAERKALFRASRTPADAFLVNDMKNGTTSSNFLWCGWSEGQIFRQFTGFLSRRYSGPTLKKNLHLTSLTFRIHSGESVIISAFGDDAKEELETVANLGKLYTFLNLKVVRNMVVESDKDGSADRGGDFPIKFRYEMGESRVIFGRISDGNPAIEYFRPSKELPKKPKKTPTYQEVSSDTDQQQQEDEEEEDEGEMTEPHNFDEDPPQWMDNNETENEDEENSEEDEEPPPPKKFKDGEAKKESRKQIESRLNAKAMSSMEADNLLEKLKGPKKQAAAAPKRQPLLLVPKKRKTPAGKKKNGANKEDGGSDASSTGSNDNDGGMPKLIIDEMEGEEEEDGADASQGPTESTTRIRRNIRDETDKRLHFVVETHMSAGHLDYSTDEHELDPKSEEWVEPEDRERYRRSLAEKRENLARKMVQWLPILEKEEEEECPICYEKGKKFKLTPCTHLFCERCLIASLAVDSRCPKCRETDIFEEIEKQKKALEKSHSCRIGPLTCHSRSIIQYGGGRRRRGGEGIRRSSRSSRTAPSTMPEFEQERGGENYLAYWPNNEEGENYDENGRFPDHWPSYNEGEGEEESIDVDRFFTVESWERTGSTSRSTATEQCTVPFHDFENASRPDTLLALCIQRLFDRVLAGRPPPIRVGFQLQCPNFDRPFFIPMRPPCQNTPTVIADALMDVINQSGDGVDIFSGLVQTKALAVWAPHQNTAHGEGGCSEVEHWLNRPQLCRSLVRVVNPDDTFCMARAILFGLMDRQCRLRGWNRQRFQKMCEQQHLHGDLARELLLRAACRTNKPHYGLPDLVRLQRMLNTELGVGQVRLVVFDQQAAFQVMWKGRHRARFNLCMVYNDRHYNYVARVEQLIKARAYCVDCERRVTHLTHPDGCLAVCRLCYRFGMKQPCKPDGTPRRRCAQCGFHFANAKCFVAHKRVVERTLPGFGADRRRRARPRESLCQQRWICGVRACGAVVWARSRRAHRCGAATWAAQRAQRPRRLAPPPPQQQQQQQSETLCGFCYGPHPPKMPCFIQPRTFEDKCQTEDVYDTPAAAAAAIPKFAPIAAAVGDDDDGPPQLEVEQSVSAARCRRRRHVASSCDENPPQLEVEHQQQQPQQPAKPICRKPIRFLWWDVETWLHADGHKHIPVLICAEVLCERCIRADIHIVEHPHRRAPNCLCGGFWQSGGRNRARWCMPMDEAQAPLTTDGRNPRRLHFHNFGGDGQPAMVQFADFLLHHGPTDVTTIALSHNGGRYDMHLLMEELQARGERPKRLLSTGLKYYVLELGGGKYRRHVLSKDTLHFFSCPLSALPRTFGLDPSQCNAKPFFPYGWMCGTRTLLSAIVTFDHCWRHSRHNRCKLTRRTLSSLLLFLFFVFGSEEQLPTKFRTRSWCMRSRPPPYLPSPTLPSCPVNFRAM